MKKYLDIIAEKKAEMRSILEGVTAEGRSGLNEEEQKRFDRLEAEVRMAEYHLRSLQVPMPSREESVHKRFLDVAISASEGKKMEEVSLRAIQNESTIHDVATPILYQGLQQPLEQGLILTRLGGRVLYNVQGEPMWSFVTGIEAEVVGENDEAGEKTLSFSSVKSTPKRITAHVPVSRRAINQSNFDLYNLVMRELGMGLSRKLNRILCDRSSHGDYSGPFVSGTMPPGAEITRAEDGVTLDDVLELEHAVLNTLTDSIGTEPCFVMNYKMAQKLRSTEIVKGQKEMLLTMHRDGGVHYAMMGERRVELSNYVPDGVIYFGDFNFLGLPQYGDISIIVDPYTGAKKNLVLFTLNTDMDMVKIRPEAFAVSKPA